MAVRQQIVPRMPGNFAADLRKPGARHVGHLHDVVTYPAGIGS